jgi:predicted Rossmann fold flavoprotein
MNDRIQYDLIVVGAGAAGMMAAIAAARKGQKVLLLEKLSKPGRKLKATGGGRCNLSNTSSRESFVKKFGRQGKFMIPALSNFDSQNLCSFLCELGVETHAPDGFRIFPVTHDATTVYEAFYKEIQRLEIVLLTGQKVSQLLHDHKTIRGVVSSGAVYEAKSVIIATGGRGYPSLGAEGDGYVLAQQAGHSIVPVFPAMLPLYTRETWVANCRADTIGKAEIRVALSGYEKLKADGDLIFTRNGVAGPVILDFSREIVPLLSRFGEVPVKLNLSGGLNEETIQRKLVKSREKQPMAAIIDNLCEIFNRPLAQELCRLAGIKPELRFRQIPGHLREKLMKILTSTPLTITGHDGFDAAMVTRGGISLKEVKPESLESRLMKGLHFCGEVLDLDGPCGGFNLQWAFSSGYLAGNSALA